MLTMVFLVVLLDDLDGGVLMGVSDMWARASSNVSICSTGEDSGWFLRDGSVLTDACLLGAEPALLILNSGRQMESGLTSGRGTFDMFLTLLLLRLPNLLLGILPMEPPGGP